MRSSNRSDHLVTGVVEEGDCTAFVTCAQDWPWWVSCNAVYVRGAQRLGISKWFTHHIEEGQDARVVANHELILLSLQPSHTGGTFFLGATWWKFETVADRAGCTLCRCRWSRIDIGAIPKDNRVGGTQRDHNVLILMILEVPNGVLLLLWVSPDCHTEVLAI